MFSILKKPVAIALLLIVTAQVKAQVPNSKPVRLHAGMTKAENEAYRAYMKQRYPQMQTASVARQAPLSTTDLMISTRQRTEAIRKEILKDHPEIRTNSAVTARPLAGTSTATSNLPNQAVYRLQAEKQLAKAKQQVAMAGKLAEEAQTPQVSTPQVQKPVAPLQQSPVQVQPQVQQPKPVLVPKSEVPQPIRKPVDLQPRGRQ